jgi:hypothetical protein
MAKPTKNLRAPRPVTPDANGQLLVLIGNTGEASADDIEAFFADIWPGVDPEATAHEMAAFPGSRSPSVGPHGSAHHQMFTDVQLLMNLLLVTMAPLTAPDIALKPGPIGQHNSCHSRPLGTTPDSGVRGLAASQRNRCAAAAQAGTPHD